MTVLAEERLVEALRARDEDAFTTLIRTYHNALLRVAQIYVSNASAAEEVVQETWLAVLSGIDRFEARSSLKTWLFTILANRARTRAARDRRAIPFSALENPAGVPEPAVSAERFLDQEHPRWPGHWAARPEPWPEERVLARETHERVATAIAALPPAQRAVVALRDVHGWSADEVCNALAITETNQRVLLHRARSKVRQALEDHLREAQ